MTPKLVNSFKFAKKNDSLDIKNNTPAPYII